MPTDVHTASEALSRHVRRRQGLLIIGRSFFVAAAIGVGYFVLPFDSSLAMDTGVELVAGLMLIAGLLAWQIRGILRSPFPAFQGVATVAITVPMFLILFATTYYLMGDTDASNFSEPLTRLDSLYFTITTFATVGFGDVTAVSQLARAVVSAQMALGLILVGLIARVIFGAVQVARSRHGHQV
jgi:voltage-gated potassium channel